MTKPNGTEGVIVLPERMDISAAATLRDRILAVEGDVTLDAGGVGIVTSPALQVLMAGRDHLAARGFGMTIADASDGFRATLRTLGVPLERLQTAGPTS